MSLIPVAVGHARECYGEKYTIGVGQTSAGGRGWTHEFCFQAYNCPVAGTVPVGRMSIRGEFKFQPVEIKIVTRSKSII